MTLISMGQVTPIIFHINYKIRVFTDGAIGSATASRPQDSLRLCFASHLFG
jgi:hypothetical protein